MTKQSLKLRAEIFQINTLLETRTLPLTARERSRLLQRRKLLFRRLHAPTAREKAHGAKPGRLKKHESDYQRFLTVVEKINTLLKES